MGYIFDFLFVGMMSMGMGMMPHTTAVSILYTWLFWGIGGYCPDMTSAIYHGCKAANQTTACGAEIGGKFEMEKQTICKGV